MDKKAKWGPLGWILLVVGIYFAWSSGMLQQFGVGRQAPAPIAPGTTLPSTFCADDQLSIKADDQMLNKAGVNPARTHALFLDRNKDGTYTTEEDFGDLTDGTSYGQIPPNMNYLLYGCWNTGTPAVFYTTKITGNTDCNDLTIVPRCPAISNTASGNYTHWVQDWDGTVYAVASNNITMGASDEKTITIHDELAEFMYYGLPGSTNELTLEYSSGLIDKLEIDGASKTDDPEFFNANTTNGYGGVGTKTFVVPILSDTDRALKLKIKTKSGQNPNGTHEATCIYGNEWDKNIDLDADYNTEILDVEDEDDNELGRTGLWSWKICLS